MLNLKHYLLVGVSLDCIDYFLSHLSGICKSHLMVGQF
uniref:Uncharacterized protein n=1 Tax=Ciona intestinalis TaxID=7719 RepID=H2XRK8_CIOIN